MATAWDDAINYLKNTCSPFITRNVILTNIPQGTTDLSPYQSPPATKALQAGMSHGELVGLMEPLDIWWKQSGQPENCFARAREQKDLPFVTPQNYVAGMGLWYEWRSYRIMLTPMSFTMDLLVKGEFYPLLPTDENANLELYPNCARALGYYVAALIGGSRVNASYIQTWKAQAESSWDDISADLVRKEQSTSQRVGRFNRRSGFGRGYGGGGY